MEATREDLDLRLRESNEEELYRLVDRHLTELEPGSVRRVLRNPFVSARVIERLIDDGRLLRSYEVRREIAAHPATPQVAALRLVSGLYWRDLVGLSREMRVRPVIRRAAENRLFERFEGFSVGERVAIARSCGAGLLPRIRQLHCVRTIGAMLENPRCSEGHLTPLVASEATRPEVLARIAADRRWGVRYRLRLALCRNRRTPQQTAIGLLPALRKRDLEAVASDPGLAAPVRRRAELLLGR